MSISTTANLPRQGNPLLSIGGIFLTALSLSMGWGIRGNYGHEMGAMFPGALAAIAVCLMSAREDWRARVAYFALFGAVGWGFGGSISYMQVIGYTHSGDLPSQVYGFAGLFLIGFLWASLGGAGTAIPAVLERKRLTEIFYPLSFLFVFWMLADIGLPILTDHLDKIDGAMKRHESALYWLDSDWVQVAVMLASMLLYDLLERRFGKFWELLLLLAAGAAVGWILQFLFSLVGFSGLLWDFLVRPQGDTSHFPVEQLITNWPNFLPRVHAHIGWGIGLIVGGTIYFARRGRFAQDSGLFVSMAVGWFVVFLLFPVFLGVRLTPPRGDSWAGILGTFLGAMFYCQRQKLQPIMLASIVCGMIGGLGFSGIALLKLVMIAPGNRTIVQDPEVLAAWKHWQSANWHSFLEQSYGFVNGIGVAVALGLLLRRLGPIDNSAPRRRGTEILALGFVIPFLLYFNMVKNVADWTSEHGGVRSLPETLRAPWFDDWVLSAWGWFNFFFAIASFAFLVLLVVHLKRPLAILPASWVGRGQLLYFLLLWCFVLGNFTKALTSFQEQRLLTEGVIIVHAVLATVLMLILPRPDQPTADLPSANFVPLVRFATILTLVMVLVAPPSMTYAVRSIYGDAGAGHGGKNLRFGPEANWRVAPILKGTLHR
ncbi:MAG: hypothetical protein U1D30_18090 [Planctomycetota bacterium]